MMKFFTRKNERRRGNAVLETAIVLPVLLSLAFGTCEFGYYFYAKNAFQGAAREGARVGIIGGNTNTDINTAVLQALTSAGFQNSQYTVTTTPASITASTAEGTQITVQVQTTWTKVGFSPLGIIPGTKPVAGVATMRHE